MSQLNIVTVPGLAALALVVVVILVLQCSPVLLRALAVGLVLVGGVAALKAI